MERWVGVPGWPSYEVSDHGRVRRIAPGRGTKTGLLTLSPGHKGYLTISLCEHGRATKFRINVLVALAFHGPRPIGRHAAHRNGNKHDNGQGNIYWATPKENAADVDLHGARRRGSQLPQARLVEAQVDEIRARLTTGALGIDLAVAYGVSEATISMIKSRQRWGHLQTGARS